MKTEKPGVQTPWPGINQLLLLDERFEVTDAEWQGYLFAPKNLSRLSALMYLLKGLQLTFEIRGRNSHSLKPYTTTQVLISVRAFKSVKYLENQTIEVGAGCGLKTLCENLFEHGLELGLEDQPWGQLTGSIGGAILHGISSGVKLRQYAISERLMGVELVKLDGGILKWQSSAIGPAFHQLIWGVGKLPAILLKCYFKGELIPASRLRMAWTFRFQQDLWVFLYSLKSFTRSWEKLDCIVSGSPNERAFLIAQISGTEKEIEAFKTSCPNFNEAILEQTESKIKSFLSKQNYRFMPISIKEASHFLTESTYIWYHVLTDRCWLVTKENSTQEEIKPINLPSEWEEKLYTCL